MKQKWSFAVRNVAKASQDWTKISPITKCQAEVYSEPGQTYMIEHLTKN